MLIVKRFASIVVAALVSMAAHAGVVDGDVPAISYVQFESLDVTNPPEPLTISGELRVPDHSAEQSVPAVVVLHGSAGIDSRGALYIQALNAAGIATLEIDMFAARGLAVGERPAFPTLNVPDAFSALAYLAADPRIDAERIGIVGFSWGGVVTMLAASGSYVDIYGDGEGFAAHVAHYPICYSYNEDLPPPLPPPVAPFGLEFGNLASPLLIQIGDRDDYDEGSGPCEALIASLPDADQSLMSLIVYRNAYHAWDRLQPAITVNDPFSHLGMGGEVTIVPSPGKAFQSRGNVVQFLQDTLGSD